MNNRHVNLFLAAFGLVTSAQPMSAATIVTSTFATGGPASKSPDSITSDSTSIFVEFGNGASSTGSDSKSSTIVRYGFSGAVLQTYSIAGSVDGLKYNNFTGRLWALQNQDGNSRLTIIDPATGAQTQYAYATSPADSTTTPRNGFDDAVFTNNGAYLSRTNPSGDPNAATIVFATLSGSVVNVSPILRYGAANTTIGGMSVMNDPDSLKMDLNGNLVLSSGDDGATIGVTNPGPGQTVKALQLTDLSGAAVGGLDDTASTNATLGTLLVTDTPNNVVNALYVTGLSGTTEFASVGDLQSVGIVDQATGAVTPIGSFATGAAPHGLLFIPNANITFVPEPATMVLVLAGLSGLAAFGRKKRI